MGVILTVGDAGFDPEQMPKLWAGAAAVRVAGVKPQGEAKAWWRAVGERLGRGANHLEDSFTGEEIPADGGWMDVRYEPDRLDTYRHANVGQPLHTDGSYASLIQDIGLFFLEKQAESGGESLFVDAETVARCASRQGDLLHRLMTLPVRHGKGRVGRNLPILFEQNGRLKINWNWFRVLPDQGEAVDTLREEFRVFLQGLVDGGVAARFRLEAGDAVFFRDDEVLHGRMGYAAKVSGDRLLWKTYFISPEAQAIEAAKARAA